MVFLAGHVAAQPVSDGNGSTVTGNAASLTLSGFSVPANNDRLLVACTENYVNQPAPTLTFAGNPMTQAVTRGSTSGLRLALYYLPLGSDGSATSGNIIASGTSLLQLGATSYHDVNQADPTDGEVNTALVSGGSGPASSMLTVTSSASDLVCDCIGTFASGFTNFTVGGGQTQLFQSNASSPNTRIAMSNKPGAASVNMSWTINGDFNGGTSVQLGMNIKAAIPLPVELTSFKGLATRDGNRLLWQTASERDHAGFEIYRSPDGLRWEFLALVAGHGGSTQMENYSWLDKTPLSGAHYYRLKQVDTNGGFTYSPAILIRSGGSGALLLYPNPAGDAVFYQYDDLERVRRIQLYDATGKLMRETAQMDGRLPLYGLPVGLYWLTLQTDTGLIQQRVWKQ